MELSEFLLARISEDEAANLAGPEPEAWCDRGEGLHLSYARVAAECEAKRRIVTEFGSSCSDYFPPGNLYRVEREADAAERGWEFQPHWPERYAPFCDGCAAAQSADLDHQRVLAILAAVYADHPDYRSEWAP